MRSPLENSTDFSLQKFFPPKLPIKGPPAAPISRHHNCSDHHGFNMWIRVRKCPKWPSLKFYLTEEILLAAFSVEDFYMNLNSEEEDQPYFGFWESSLIGEDLHRFLEEQHSYYTAIYIFNGSEPLESDIKHILSYLTNKESLDSQWVFDSLFTSCDNCEFPVELDCISREEERGHIKKNGTCCKMSGCTYEEWWERTLFPLSENQTDFSQAQFY